MAGRLLEGRPVADRIWQAVQVDAERLAQARGRPPTLAILASDDDAAQAYQRQIERAFAKRGLAVTVVEPPSDAVAAGRALEGLSAHAGVDGVLVMSPLPGGVAMQSVIEALDPCKDVDGQHPANLGLLVQRRRRFVPSTALGGLRLLEHYEIPLRGARTVVVGRSPVVGLPLSLLLVDADATVSVCHTRTRDVAAVAREADVLCVAAGRAGLIGPEAVKLGATVIDFGTNVAADGTLVGDVRTAEVAEVAGAVTPVPGGTGSVTVAVLAEQTVAAAALASSEV